MDDYGFTAEETFDWVVAFWIAVAAILFAACIVLPLYFGSFQP